jgi:hypothetical protein
MIFNWEYKQMIEQVQNKIKAIQELFGDKEVTLPVTFKIVNGNVTADIGQFTINDNAKVTASEPEISKNVATGNELRKWTDKLPAKFISLAVRYNGMNRFVYYTLHNEGGIIKVQWKNTLTGNIEEITPYITVREFSRGSMKYLMNLCNEESSSDKWRDFDVFKITPGNWNSVVKETLLTDPKAKDSAMTVVIYDIHTKSVQLVHLDQDDVNEIEEATAKDMAQQEHR